MTWEAERLPQKLSTAAETITAVVLPAAEMMEPMDGDKMNWAMKTMEETSATSVPRPRCWVDDCLSPFSSSANCW